MSLSKTDFQINISDGVWIQQSLLPTMIEDFPGDLVAYTLASMLKTLDRIYEPMNIYSECIKKEWINDPNNIGNRYLYIRVERFGKFKTINKIS